MLPRYPKVENFVQRRLSRYLQARSKANAGVFALARREVIYEGHRTFIKRADGSSDYTEFMTAEHSFEISREKAKSLSMHDVLEQHDEVAKSLGSQQARHFFQTLDKTVQKIGNSVDGQAKPLTPELIFEAIEAIQFDFNPDGSPIWPTMVVPPQLLERARGVMKEIEDTPPLKKRLEKLIERKREEYRAREANRNLAG